MSLARDKERVAALTGGLALTIITWTFAAGYTPDSLDAIGGLFTVALRAGDDRCLGYIYRHCLPLDSSESSSKNPASPG